MVATSIKERRKRPHVKRTFERRSSDDESARAIHKLEEMGAEKVEAMLSRGLFGNQSGAAKQWLGSQGESRSGGWVLKLTFAAAIGCIGGVVLFFAF